VDGSFDGNNTGAYAIQASYAHNLSKQTQPFIMLSYTDAGNASAYNGPFGNNGLGLGGKTTMIVVGLQHSF
jgi:predicted porin